MSLWLQLIQEIENFPREIRHLRVSPQVSPEKIRAELESHYSFDTPIPLETLTEEVIRLLRTWTVHVTHPRYFGLFNPSVRQASIIADALAALYNPQLAAWSHAPAANELERLSLHRFARALGIDAEPLHANFTTGGAEANLSAVLAALAQHLPAWSESGLFGRQNQPAIYLTRETHHSFVKVARMTGLGTNALREIPIDSHLMMDIDALQSRIETDRASGWHPLMVVGTAGTTSAGIVDPLEKLAGVATKYGVWFHVDAAWGGSAVLSAQLKAIVSGIERADSITWDAHKWLSVPMGAGMFFCRHPEAIKQAFAITTSYMPNAVEGSTVDPYATSAQWSRRAIGLKVFMALAELGISGYGELIERQTQMGDYLRERLRQCGWEVVNETRLPVVCFTHPDIQQGFLSTSEILQTIYERGQVWISDVILSDQERVLRACITSFHTNESDIECLLEEIEYARQSNESERWMDPNTSLRQSN
jgi:glutamate/tyrosine decarboxylase-like PLP-dependent enzyme